MICFIFRLTSLAALEQVAIMPQTPPAGRPLRRAQLNRGQTPLNAFRIVAVSRASPAASLPSVDRLMRHHLAEALILQNGRAVVRDAVRHVLATARGELAATGRTAEVGDVALLDRVAARIAVESRPSLRPVFNLTGTVLHTNLGRALLPDTAADAMREAALRATNL